MECIDLTNDEPASSGRGGTSVQGGKESNGQLCIVTWNIDGLDTDNLRERARGLCSYLVLYDPDVVFLQEVIPPYLEYLKKRAVSYTIIEGNEDCYFTAIMLKKSHVKLLKSETINYPTTDMMRNLLIAQVKIHELELCLMTSHLESCKEHSQERMNQLRKVWEKMREAPANVTVIFGGDTNLRDHEVAKLGGLPSGVCDIWEFLGRPEHCKYTWDTKTNTNRKVCYVSRLRFDRVLLRAAKEGARVVPEHMDLIGLEKLDCGRFTSDHWGILCGFTIQT
uniref:Tyrosyl-DNA phosphodiesterase 2 n=2 Tax=Lepisosteus oculatus TaxID=7918 RepID=W5MF67_LEPOC